MSSAERLRHLERELRGRDAAAVTVLHIVEKALDVPAPGGAPGAIRAFADGYNRASVRSGQAGLELSTLGRQRIPQVWIGVSGVAASDAVGAGARRAERNSRALGECARALHALADAIQNAQAADARGRDDLRQARGQLEHMTWLWGERDNPFTFSEEGLDQAAFDAGNGLMGCLDGAKQAEAASADAMKVLAHWTAEANGAVLKSAHLSAAEMLVIADASVPGGPNDLNLILDTAQADRASHRLDGLSGPDRGRFDRLLHHASSPQERAYLLKALAAGHTVDQIEGFAGSIHPHGADPAWLRDHLTPLVGTGDRTEDTAQPVTFGGARWGVHKGQDADSIAASVVTARAQLDPLYSLQLTTGGHPDDPRFDNPESFQQRLWDEQDRIHAKFSEFAARTDNYGVPDYALTQVTTELGPLVDMRYRAVNIGAVGEPQEYTVLVDNEWRPTVLPKIKEAIDRGLPVALTLQEQSTALGGNLAFSGPQLEVLIVGYGGGKLQLYLPDGSTRWLSEDEWFVNGERYDIHPNPLTAQLPG